MSVGSGRGICEVCRREVGKLETAAYFESGWTIERSKGTNALFHRQRDKNRIAHEGCIRSYAYRDQVSMDLGSAA